MEKVASVKLEKVVNEENQYIVKDEAGITSGRVFIIEVSEENRYCTLRIKFYRKDSYKIIKDTLRILLRILFNKRSISKVNVLVDELVSTRPFTDMGFSLQGIMEDSIFLNGEYRSELIFGINSYEFGKLQKNSKTVLMDKCIELKILTPEDSEDVLNYIIRNRDHLEYFEPLRDESYFTLDSQKKILIEEYNQYLNGTGMSFGIFKDNKLIGKVKLSNIVYGVFRSCFLGYSIDEKEQGKGIMKRAVSLVVDYAFQELDLHRIEASTLTDNFRSQNVLKACGFQELGVNKKYLYINGAWMDHILFYKIRD